MRFCGGDALLERRYFCVLRFFSMISGDNTTLAHERIIIGVGFASLK